MTQEEKETADQAMLDRCRRYGSLTGGRNVSIDDMYACYRLELCGRLKRVGNCPAKWVLADVEGFDPIELGM